VGRTVQAGLVAALAVGLSLGCAETPADTRDDVIAGARDDFRHAEGVPSEFVDCFLPELRHALERESLDRLIAIRRDRGQPAAARALNGLAAPIGDRCGERWHVPQLIGAAGGLG
jgi:hypothetical protein